MKKDVYNDQIMGNHLSRTWADGFNANIREILAGWKILHQAGNQELMMSRDGITVSLEMFHTPDELFDCDVLISEVVTSHHNQLKLWPEFYGIYHHEFEYSNHIPNKKLNCFINRSCPIRQSWFYQLIREDILDNTYSSFWSHNFDHVDLNPVELFDYYYEQNRIFESEHNAIRSQIPFKNFDCTLEEAIIDSEKSIVIETFFEETDMICFTEKTMRVLQLPRPWLLFGNPGSVTKLREWGFDVFDDWIDHSYDAELDPIRRQRLILDQIHSTIPYTQSLLDNFEERAKHNRNLLKQYQQQFINKKENVILENLKDELCRCNARQRA